MGPIQTNPFLPATSVPSARGFDAAALAPDSAYDALVDRHETLIRELVTSKHNAARNNTVAFRAYQLRTRKIMSNAQQASFVAATAHFGIYALGALPVIATAFTVKRQAAKSLSFHVWKQFTEHAKDKPQQKAIHAALKRHGIIHHEDTLWGALGRNHWRTLRLPTDANGELDAQDLRTRMDKVMDDLAMSALWTDDELGELRPDVTCIIEEFAALTRDLATYGHDWQEANTAVKKLAAQTTLTKASRPQLLAARTKRAELKHHIVVGDENEDKAALREEIDVAIARSRSYTRAGARDLAAQNEGLLRELVEAKHKKVRDNEIAFRAYQLRTRKLMSNVQQASFVGLTAHMGAYLLPVLPLAATTFTVKRFAARSLSFHVWKQFTEHAKDKAQQKAIHGALKRHGIVHHEKSVWGWLGRNHWRTLELPTDDAGNIEAALLAERMDAVTADLRMAGLWSEEQLVALRDDVTTILKNFAALNADLHVYSADWSKANRDVKKHWLGAQFSASEREKYRAERSERAAIKHHITVGDDTADDAKLAQELEALLSIR